MIFKKNLFSMALVFSIIHGSNSIDIQDRKIDAYRIQGEGLKIDGLINEPLWNSAQVSDAFIQRDPIEGANPTEKTEFRVLYDDEYLYVGISAFDSNPDSIRSILTRRDEDSPSDWLYVSLDSYNDNRTAFQFGLNPLGVKRDVRWFDDENRDPNWDALWEGKSAITGEGWFAEFKIPLRELRFSDAKEQTWGIQIQRYISRKNEYDYWRFWTKEESGVVRHFGELNHLNNIPKQRRLTIKPYVTSSYSAAPWYSNPINPDSYATQNNLGVDIKFGLTNNLTLDLTINPDFGQVEADPAELNLSAFETYFSERRPFFVEGGNIFNFSLGVGDGNQSSNTLFYTRRIGRSPHRNISWYDGYTYLDSIYINGDSLSVDQPSATTIIAAGKISGKTESGWSVGILNALAEEEWATVEFPQKSFREIVEPRTNYFVSRLQKDFREGKTTVGGILTAINRNLNKPYLQGIHHDAYSGGVDFSHLFYKERVTLTGAVTFTNVLGTTEAILNTQTSSNHYFQRPNTSHLDVDSTATGLTGFSGKFAFFYNGPEHWSAGFGNFTFSPKFNAQDLGFTREGSDNYTNFIYFSYRENTPAKYLRNWRVNFNTWKGYTFDGTQVQMSGNVNGNMTFSNYWSTGFGYNFQGAGHHRTVLWGGPAIKTGRGYNSWFYLSSDYRKSISISGFAYRGSDKTGTSWTGTEPNMTWRPTKNISTTASLGYHRISDKWATWNGYSVSTDGETGESKYLLANLEQTTFSTTLRLDITLTPNFTVQFYGSPFITAGKYFDHIMLNEEYALADEYDDRFDSLADQEFFNEDQNMWEIDSDGNGITNFFIANRDFNYKAYNSNLVLRWEYKTGSTLYLVWSNSRSHWENFGNFNFQNNFKSLSESDAENILLIKFDHLFAL